MGCECKSGFIAPGCATASVGPKSDLQSYKQLSLMISMNRFAKAKCFAIRVSSATCQLKALATDVDAK